MSNTRATLIIFASWEDRFLLGLEKNHLKFEQIDRTCVFYYVEYLDMTESNRVAISDYGPKEMVELRAADPLFSWKVCVQKVRELSESSEELLVDFSTMPREIMWYILWETREANATLECLYYSPDDYGADWLSRDPRAPRMAFKLSGLADPSKRTALLVTTGYDIQRVWRLVHWCEPERLMVGVQEGGRFERSKDVMRDARHEFGKIEGWEVFGLDAFAEDFGESKIVDRLESVSNTHNVMLASMGVKLTALPLYRIQQRNDSMGLVYAPAGEYSESYSKGIGEFYSCRIVGTGKE